MKRFIETTERQRKSFMHDLENALSDAMAAMSSLSDLGRDMSDFEDSETLDNRKLAKLFNELEALIEAFDEDSTVYDRVNTIHSKVIGIDVDID